MAPGLLSGTVVLVDLGATLGREQSGVRPAVVMSSDDFAEVIDRLTVIVPCTRVDRGWVNHIRLEGDTGLTHLTFAMSEQVRTIATERILRARGRVDAPTLALLSRWVHHWLHPAA